MGTLLVTADSGSLPLIGNPAVLPVAYKVIGVLLATGTGGKRQSKTLSS